MNTAISQKEDLLKLSQDELCDRVITLEIFARNLAQKYFAQDDYSRRTTAMDRNRPVELHVNGREAFEHWIEKEGPRRFSEHFPTMDSLMHAFCREGVGEKPPPPV